MKRFSLMLIQIFVILCVLYASNAVGQVITAEQEQQVKQAAKKLLEKYALFATFSEDGVKISDEYVNGFLGTLSSSSSLVFDDINPSLKKGAVVTAVEYVNMVRNRYPSGFDLIVDTENFAILYSKEAPRKQGHYLVSVKVTKELFGLTKQNVLHSFKGDLIFQLEAVIENGKVNNVTIAAINDNTRYKNLAADDRLRGFHLSLVGEPAQSQLSSSTLMENTYWQQQPQVGFNFGVNFTWFFNRLFGVTVGAHKTEYVTNFLLNSFSGQSTIEMIDEDNDKYYQVYEISDLTEMNSLNYIEVPLMLNYRTGRAKTGIYLDLGLVYALSLNTSYQVEGLTNRMGYYPEYDLLLDDIPEYGFETVVLDDAGSWQVKSSSLSGIARLGLSFPISQKIYFKVGGVAVYGIDDILYNKPKHNEDFISTMGIIPTSTTLLRIGLEAGVSLKLY